MTDSVDYSYERGQLDNTSKDLSQIKPPTLPIDKEFHILISYRAVSPDRDIALIIDKLLRNNGYKCCLHERYFGPGASILNNIIKLIECSVKVVFLLSESSSSSEWCQFELNVAETMHIENKGYKPIILKLDDCMLPDNLRRYTYLAADTPVEKWINRLANAINDQTDLFVEIRALGKETVEEFNDMLSAGSYKCYWNRVYLAGAYNMGKTTLAKNLVGDPVPETRESTNGIWIYLGRAGMSTEDKKWIFLEQGKGLNAAVQSFLMSSRKEENKKEPSDDEMDVSQVKDRTNPPIQEEEGWQPSQPNQEATKGDLKVQKTELSNEEIVKLVLTACQKSGYKMKMVPIDLWDFGGQKIYYMTHQLFISSRGMFVIIFNGSLGLHDEISYLAYLPGQPGIRTMAVYLIHWVNSILTYCQTSKEGFPKILFVATHKDLVKTARIERQREELTVSIEKLFENHAGKSHLQIRPLIFVNAKDTSDPEVNNLRNSLVDTAFSHPRWGELMPTLFVPLELQLAACVKEGKKIMTRAEIDNVNAVNGTMALTMSQLKTFLKLQHALGKYIYIEEGHLKDYVVIDPAYLIDVLRSIVTEEQFWPKDKELRGIFVKLKEEGIIRKIDLLKLWEQKDFCHILPFKEYMIEMLIHLDIIIEPRSSITTIRAEKSEEKFYLVPCMITKPNEMHMDRNDAGIHMAYTFIEELIPPAFLYKFLGAFISMWKMKSLYTDSAVVSIDRAHELYVSIDKNRFVVTLIHAKNKKDIVPTIASTVQESLTRAIVRITQFYWTASDSESSTENVPEATGKKTVVEFSEATNPNRERKQKRIIPYKIEFGVHCTSELCFFDHNRATESSNYKLKCPKHEEWHDTSDLKLWFAEKGLHFARKDDIVCDIGCPGLGILDCQRTPSDKELGRLAASLTLNVVRDLYNELGLTSEKYEELDRDYPYTADLKFYALWQWKQSSSKPTFARLKDAFTRIKYDHHKLCEVFRDIDITVFPECTNPRYFPDVPEERLTDPPEDDFLENLSNNIGRDIIQLGIELEIKASALQTIDVKYKTNLMEQTREIIRIWKKRNLSCYCLAKAFKRIGKLGAFSQCFNCWG